MSNEPSNSLGTTPARCSSLRKGGYAMIKGHPCKIMDMATSAPGKHGHAKIHMVGLDLFSRKRYEDIQPSSHNIDVPQVLKIEMQLVSIGHEGYMSLLDDAGYIQHHLALPDDPLGETIRQKYDDGDCVMVVIQKALNLEAVHSYKIVKE